MLSNHEVQTIAQNTRNHHNLATIVLFQSFGSQLADNGQQLKLAEI